MLNILKISWRFLKTLYERFFEDDCSYRAAALTYTTLLSLVPLMAVSFSILSAFPVFKHLTTEMQNFIFSHFVAASGEVVQEYLTKFLAQTKHLTAIGSFFLVITAVLMMFTMERALNAIWHVKSRGISISTFLLYWAILTLTPILLGLSMVLSTYITNISFVTTTAESLSLMRILPFILNLIVFMILYVVVPNCHVRIRNAFIGGLVASILFTIAKAGFAYYVTHFPTYILLYGALATIPLFLIWIYVSWVIILFGAILCHLLSSGYRFRSTQQMDGFTHLYCWLGYFWAGLQKGKQLAITDLLRLDSCDYEVDPVELLKRMQEAHLIQAVGKGRFVLSQDLSTLTLKSLFYKMPWRLPSSKELKQWDGQWEKRLEKIIEDKNTQVGTVLDIPLAELYRSP